MPDEASTSLDAMRFEIENQVEGLRDYSRYLLSNGSLPAPSAEQLIFAGSGDSYCSALWAFEMSHGKSPVYDPFELGLKPHWAQNKQVFIISVTGRTRANLFLAKRLKGVATKVVAITSSSQNELTSECDEMIRLQYVSGKTLTSGTASFSASLLACAHLLAKVKEEVHFKHNFHPQFFADSADSKGTSGPEFKELATKRQREREKLITRDGVVVFVGTGMDYPLAQYAALKFNEVLGLKALPSFPEPIGHSLLFSLNPKKDRVVVLDPTSNRRLREITKVLSDLGIPIYEMHVPPQNELSRTMELTFDVQMLAYNLARDQGMKECAFLSDKNRLEASSHLIY